MQCMHPLIPRRSKRNNHIATTTQRLMQVLPIANTTYRPSPLNTLPMVNNPNPRSPHISIMCHVLRHSQILHIASNNCTPTHLWLTSPSLTLRKVNHLTPSHWCTHTPFHKTKHHFNLNLIWFEYFEIRFDFHIKQNIILISIWVDEVIFLKKSHD